MKKLLIGLTSLVLATGAFAQDANVNFSNALGGTPTPVTADGVTAGADWTAELVVGGATLGSGALLSIGGTPTGIFNLGEVAIPGNSGTEAEMTINVYKTEFGSVAGTPVGESYFTTTFTHTPSAVTTPPTPAAGLAGSIDSFSLETVVPEPTAIALALVGAGVFAARRRRA